MKDYCIVCGSHLKIETKKNLAHGVGTVTDISGRSLREIICLVFPNDEELQVMLRVAESDPEFPIDPEQGPAVCHACHNLVEQIDAFEMHLNRTRESLVLRRDKKVTNGTVTTAPSTSRRGAVNLTSNLNLEALSQLPPTTKIETILKVEPDDDNNFDNEDYFPDIIDEDFLLDVPFNNTIKKEFGDSGWSSSNQDILVKEPNTEYDSDDKHKDEDYIPPAKIKKTREKREKAVKPAPPTKKVTAGPTKISSPKPAAATLKLRVPIINFAAVPDMLLEPDPTKTTELMGEVENDEQREAVKDFESDVQFLKTILPMEITTQANSDSWLQYLLRSESDLGYSGVVGELKCFECDWKFRSVALKLSHVIKMHSGKNIKPYGCERCENTNFISEEDAFNHVCNEHDIKAVNGCGIREPRLSSESSSLKFFCNHCAVVSSTELGYWFHFWTRHKKYTDAKCKFCPDAPVSAIELRRHVLLNHLGYKFACEQPECDFQAKTTEAMLVHIKSHNEGEEVALDVIGTKGATIGKMKRKNGDDDDVDGEVDEDGEAKYVGRKPNEQLSHYARRSREMKPLSIYERANINCDQYLVESSASAAALKLVPQLHRALDEQIQLLKTMPNMITTQEESVSWDVALLRSEATKLTFGIPGENKCFKCDATTKNPADKHYHILSVHGAGQQGESYRCSHCSKVWSSEETAFHHAKTKHMSVWNQDKGEKREPIVLADGGLKCRYCTIVASSELAFWVHTMARHKRFKQIRCEMCSQLCCNGPQFRRHVLIHHGQYRYKCPECPESFRPVDSFKIHIKEHERIKLIDDYEKKKADRIAKGLPLSLLEDEKPPEPFPKRSKKLPAEFLTCELCGKESRGEKFHAKHLFTVHGIEKKMSCTECGKECSSIRALEAHRRSEHSVASCHFCGKSFFSSSHLTSHLRQVHEVGTKDDDYICEICARTFPTKAYLRIHMRTHREKHIKCQLCPKMFRWESALRSHLAAAHTETNQIIHQCEYCGKQFKDKSNLKSHRYTHLDVKPHSCSKCGRGFIRRDMMLTHEKNCRL